MASDSFYEEIKGRVMLVTEHGFVNIQAFEVKDKWSKQWHRHPTSCITSARIANVNIIDEE